MRKAELIRILNSAKTARDGADWHGKFDAGTRSLTKTHRYQHIAKPLDDVIAALQKELDRVVRKRMLNRVVSPQRLPYKDD